MRLRDVQNRLITPLFPVGLPNGKGYFCKSRTLAKDYEIHCIQFEPAQAAPDVEWRAEHQQYVADSR